MVPFVKILKKHQKNVKMKTPRSYRKFQFQQDKIKNLEEKVLALKEFILNLKIFQTKFGI
jgi:hypothetical protein